MLGKVEKKICGKCGKPFKRDPHKPLQKYHTECANKRANKNILIKSKWEK